MSYTLTLAIDLGPQYAGLTLEAQLYDVNGVSAGAPITTGFIARGLAGNYQWTNTFEDYFRGGVDIVNTADATVLASGTINPEDALAPEIEGTTDLLGAVKFLYDKAEAGAAAPCRDPNIQPIPTPTGNAADMPIVRAGIPEMDNCPILTRLNAFIVEQGVTATLEHTLRDRQGNPIDLSAFLATALSETSAGSASVSEPPGPPGGCVRLRVKEWLGSGVGVSGNPIWGFAGDSVHPEAGVLRASLPAGVVERAGIYELSWGIFDADNRLVFANTGILSVEKTLFPLSLQHLYENLGPPTLQEIRMWIMDSSPSENTLLSDIEFKDEQLLLAIFEPVRYWNEALPPLRPMQTTRTFPYRGAWTKGIIGQLHLMMAAHFRRNYLQVQGGGIAAGDKAKEREYLAEGQRCWQEYIGWVANKKVALNMRGFFGGVRSDYSARSGW